MKWVTTEHVHLDRVACPWLIVRFIDPEAEFLFVPRDKQDQLPKGAIPVAIAGAELGPHDADGTTFDKILQKYNLNDPTLDLLAGVIRSGVHHALHKGRSDENDVEALAGIGLDALSEGIMLTSEDDLGNIQKSMAMYDALYAYCRAQILLVEDPSLALLSFFERNKRIKAALSRKGL
jgi:hypothetical protein